MMEHDPLCAPLADYNMHWVPAEQCRICPKIRKIRADERERAAERVAALLEVFPGSGSVYKSEVVAANHVDGTAP